MSYQIDIKLFIFQSISFTNKNPKARSDRPQEKSQQSSKDSKEGDAGRIPEGIVAEGLIAEANLVTIGDDEWILDSGASHHMTFDKEALAVGKVSSKSECMLNRTNTRSLLQLHGVQPKGKVR